MMHDNGSVTTGIMMYRYRVHMQNIYLRIHVLKFVVCRNWQILIIARLLFKLKKSWAFIAQIKLCSQ